MNHDINSPSAGPGSPSNEAYETMVKCLLEVKDSFSAITAKILIESFGSRRMAEIHGQHYEVAAKVARDMIMTTYGMPGNDDHHAVLYRHVVEYAHVWKNVDMSLTHHVQRFAERMAIERPKRDTVVIVIDESRVTDNPFAIKPGETVRDMRPDELKTIQAMLPKLSPNDVIATLIDIAHKANDLVASAHGKTDRKFADYDIDSLADALAPLEQLPLHCAGVIAESGPTRARWALDSFLTGARITAAGDSADVVYGAVTVAPIIARGLAQELDYPGTWDTAAYPTLGEALIEFVGAAQEDAKLVPPNDGWVICRETVIELPDGKKELGYTLLSGVGVFTDEGDVSKTLGDLQLPLGFVYMKVEQLLPGYIMPPRDDTATLQQPVNEVFAVRNYDDTYVQSLIDAVADISTDGTRFRVLMWLMEFNKTWEERPVGEPTPEEIEHFANFHRAEAVMNECEPTTLDEMRAALDAVSLLGIVPNMPSHYFSMAGAYDTLNDKAVELARGVLDTYVDFLKPICKYCGGHVPGDNTDTLSEAHKADCVVTKARQLIEDQS